MPPKPAAGKGKKLPTWAYIAAALIGVLLVFFLFRKGGSSSTDQTVPVTTQTPSDQSGGTGTGTDNQGLVDFLTALFGASGAASNTGDGTGGLGNGEGNSTTPGKDNDLVHGPIPSGLPAHPQPPGSRGHCTAPSAPDGTTYACSWCQSGTAIKKNGLVDLCA